MTFYDESVDALSFVTPFMIAALPKFHFVVGLVLASLTLAFLARLVLTWYPEVNLKKGFWGLVFLPTEPILALTRRFVAPIGGVDVTPVIWLGIVSLVRELLVGQQGLMSQLLLKNQGIG